MKYMLDTNICIYAQKGVPQVLEKIKENRREGLAVSAVTLAKLEYGISASTAPQKNTLSLLKFLTVTEILPFDSSAASEYGKICARLRRKGTPIGTMDMLIAAHARSQNLIIVTHNVREFEHIENLKIEDWF
ncbi:MAG: type II toxin-antitoxin system VapC family toxin [Ruminococcus sp.]|nr:type II toxin-antitoxin system VapC family toxin [Ruminococcus sp.]